jgi:hypothetical protein
LLLFEANAIVRHPARDWAELVRKQRRIVGGRLSLAGFAVWPRLQVLMLSLRPVISESIRVSRYQSLPLQRRFVLLSLVLRLRSAVIREWLRLQLKDQTPLR